MNHQNSKIFMFVIIGIFIALVAVGAVADALLSEKAKTSSGLRYLLNALPSPYNLMRLYARVGDNLDDFTRAHAVSGMGYLGIMLIIAGFAWWADQQVLYGMEFLATRDESYAFWQSVGIATIIQAILLFNGGMAIKLYINGMLDNSDHNIQFRIHALLGIIALASTGYLSFQTYSTAEARGYKAEQIVKAQLQNELTEKSQKFDGEIIKLRQIYSVDSQRIAAVYLESEAAAIATFVADSTRKANDADRKVCSRAYAGMRIDAYRSIREKSIKQALETKRRALDSVNSVLGPQMASLQKMRTGLFQTVENKTVKTENDLNGQVELNATATRYKNIILNILALFFNLGLQFFARGANATEREKRQRIANSQNVYNDTQNIDIPFDNGSSSGSTSHVDNTRNDQTDTGNLGKSGGTIEGNVEIEQKQTPTGQILLLFQGQNKDEWWGWSQWRSALVNRINKYKKAKSDASRKTQLDWIRLIESKMQYIETHEPGANYGKRNQFNPANPEKPVF